MQYFFVVIDHQQAPRSPEVLGPEVLEDEALVMAVEEIEREAPFIRDHIDNWDDLDEPDAIDAYNDFAAGQQLPRIVVGHSRSR